MNLSIDLNGVSMKFMLLLIALFAYPAVAQNDLDCETASTTTDINHCLSLELDAAEAEMEKYLHKSQERYAGDRVVVDSIVAAQNAWLVYREAHCSSVFNVWRDGTIRTSMSIGCSLELTRQRTFDLWRSFLRNADSTAPLLPEPVRN